MFYRDDGEEFEEGCALYNGPTEKQRKKGKIMADDKDSGQRLKTPEFRVSYPHLFKAQQMEGAQPAKFSITMLFPKEANLKAIHRAIKAAKIAEFGSDEKKWPKKLKSAVKDGDGSKFSEKEGYAGHWVIKATTGEDYPPELFYENGKRIKTQSDIYPGCWGEAVVFCRVWKHETGGTGIHFILDAFKKTRDDESFSSRKGSAELFGFEASDDDEDDAEASEESEESFDTDSDDSDEESDF